MDADLRICKFWDIVKSPNSASQYIDFLTAHWCGSFTIGESLTEAHERPLESVFEDVLV